MRPNRPDRFAALDEIPAKYQRRAHALAELLQPRIPELALVIPVTTEGSCLILAILASLGLQLHEINGFPFAAAVRSELAALRNTGCVVRPEIMADPTEWLEVMDLMHVATAFGITLRIHHYRNGSLGDTMTVGRDQGKEVHVLLDADEQHAYGILLDDQPRFRLQLTDFMRFVSHTELVHFVQCLARQGLVFETGATRLQDIGYEAPQVGFPPAGESVGGCSPVSSSVQDGSPPVQRSEVPPVSTQGESSFMQRLEAPPSPMPHGYSQRHRHDASPHAYDGPPHTHDGSSHAHDGSPRAQFVGTPVGPPRGSAGSLGLGLPSEETSDDESIFQSRPMVGVPPMGSNGDNHHPISPYGAFPPSYTNPGDPPELKSLERSSILDWAHKFQLYRRRGGNVHPGYLLSRTEAATKALWTVKRAAMQLPTWETRHELDPDVFLQQVLRLADPPKAPLSGEYKVEAIAATSGSFVGMLEMEQFSSKVVELQLQQPSLTDRAVVHIISRSLEAHFRPLQRFTQNYLDQCKASGTEPSVLQIIGLLYQKQSRFVRQAEQLEHLAWANVTARFGPPRRNGNGSGNNMKRKPVTTQHSSTFDKRHKPSHNSTSNYNGTPNAAGKHHQSKGTEPPKPQGPPRCIHCRSNKHSSDECRSKDKKIKET